MERPQLRAVNLHEALQAVILAERNRITFTMSVGQWDVLLQAAYDYHCTLIELDENEMPVAAYRKDDSND